MNSKIQDYSQLDDDTKKFIKKAIEIYYAIKDKNIVIDVVHGKKEITYEVKNFDKKVMALFLAGMMSDCHLKVFMDEYPEFKKDDIFDFLDLKEEEIKPFDEGQYEFFYNTIFKFDVSQIINEGTNAALTVQRWTPEVIICAMKFMSLHGSYILDYYAEKYNVVNINRDISDHTLFKVLDEYNEDVGSTVRKEVKKDNNNTSFPIDFIPPFNDWIDFKKIKPIKPPEPQVDMRKVPGIIEEEEKPSVQLSDTKFIENLVEEVKSMFIGQEEAAEDICYNVINNLQLAQGEEVHDGQRSIMFVDGPTGTGKTAITRMLTKKLGVPFVATSITDYSITGYVGRDLVDILGDLLKAADNNVQKAEHGVVILDEFNKIAFMGDGSGSFDMKRGVQRELLNFMGGGTYQVNPGGALGRTLGNIKFDTSKLTFICLGALTELREEKLGKKNMGFGADVTKEEKNVDFTITPDDLVHIGFERELIGRINTYLHTNEYSRDALEKILRESPISPMLDFKAWIESKKKKLVIDDEVYRMIADKAYELKTGARSLQTVMNGIRTEFLKQVLIGNSDTIELNAEVVRKACNKMTSRKGRV